MEYFQWFATTITGLEDLAAKEVEEEAGVTSVPDIGKIFFKGTVEHAVIVNYSSTMVNRVFLLLAREDVESLEDVYRVAKSLDYSWLIDPNQTFAVRAERHAKHLSFTSIEASAKVGRGIIDSYREKSGVKLRVNLDEPDLEFYCLLRDSEMLLGLDTTGLSLHRRYYRVYYHRASLQPTIASGMIKISGWSDRESLLDPMCGGATIPIEAAIKLKKIPPGLMRGDLRIGKLKFVDRWVLRDVEEKIKKGSGIEKVPDVVGVDVSPKSIEGAKKNVEAASVIDIVKLVVADVFKIGEWLNWEPDHIVTNPPYGIRMGIRDIANFYKRLIENIRRASPKSKLTVIVSKPTLFKKILDEEGYSIISTREIMYGRLRASIICSER
ncbi:MAG: tRNA (guanine(6)-N2)-methyltransferase [Aigarchaeota archaeon]|nr:tRNA (guanine(6)-N2)-methyltransferase [Aigarchaeota archaeon]MCX8193100.1 tRNA (guanine(6)-N2)-methyltransferase [Nitrososphaeria archaeon]MDW7986723.1 tRNA (guanine(6)-N2)-methyltransferase [Nitrososphaerota archaeon]